MPTFLQTVWVKIVAILLAIFIVFTLGMITEHKFHLAGETKTAQAQTVKVGEGQNQIIKFQQDISHVKKTKCDNVKLDLTTRQLLK